VLTLIIFVHHEDSKQRKEQKRTKTQATKLHNEKICCWYYCWFFTL